MGDIVLHSEEDFSYMRRAGKLAAQTLDYIRDYVRPGVTTNFLNDLCHNFILDAGAVPAPLNYKGFPKSICTSKNSVVCHGIPDDSELREKDILNIDVTVILDGWHGDTSRMFFVGGEASIKARRLCEASYGALMDAIGILKPGMMLNEIGRRIEQYVAAYGYSSVREYCGHGIGSVFHTDPSVSHVYDPDNKTILECGMFFTIEPMINAGKPDTILSRRDGWTVKTRDGSLSAQFEHTVGITDDGFEIFTMSPKGIYCPWE